MQDGTICLGAIKTELPQVTQVERFRLWLGEEAWNVGKRPWLAPDVFSREKSWRCGKGWAPRTQEIQGKVRCLEEGGPEVSCAVTSQCHRDNGCIFFRAALMYTQKPLGDSAGSVPDHCHKANVAIK